MDKIQCMLRLEESQVIVFYFHTHPFSYSGSGSAWVDPFRMPDLGPPPDYSFDLAMRDYITHLYQGTFLVFFLKISYVLHVVVHHDYS